MTSFDVIVLLAVSMLAIFFGRFGKAVESSGRINETVRQCAFIYAMTCRRTNN